MRQLIINCDDFGLSPGVSGGIIEAIKSGVASSTTVMTCIDDDFLNYKDDLMGLNASVGLHLQLTSGTPRLDVAMIPSLVNDSGTFHRDKNKVESADPNEILREWLAQYERFTELGFRPSHLDSHHHIHKKSNVLPVFLKLAKKLNLPIRILKSKIFSKQALPERRVLCVTKFYGDGADMENIYNAFDDHDHVDKLELMCHPGNVDAELRERSSYVDNRAVELGILTSEELKEKLNEKQIEIINWNSI